MSKNGIRISLDVPQELFAAMNTKLHNRHRKITRHEWIIRAIARKAEYKLPPKRSWK